MFLTRGDELIKYARMILSTPIEMKHLGIMHYFLGMDVWKCADGIFLGQGKYVVEILKKFGMLDCKAITTPMTSNLKLLCDASSETIDVMMYRQMIDSLMYLMNTIPYICFVVNILSQFLMYLRHVHLMLQSMY